MKTMNTTANEINERLIIVEDWIESHKDTKEILEKKSHKKSKDMPKSEDITKIMEDVAKLKDYFDLLQQLFQTKNYLLTPFTEAMRFQTIVQIMVEGTEPRSLETIHAELQTTFGDRISYAYLVAMQNELKPLNRPNLSNATTALIKMFEADFSKKKSKPNEKSLDAVQDGIQEEDKNEKNTESGDATDETDDFVNDSPFEKEGDANRNL